MAENNSSVSNKQTKAAEYNCWRGMKQRCYNPSATGYHRYGGRGITVCERWRTSFSNFLEDMGPRPSKEHSVDRINNDLDYSPSNCRWSTRKEQQRNRDGNVLLTLDGTTMCLKDWAASIGISERALRWRLDSGWSSDKALTTPRVSETRRGVIMLTHDGTTLSLQEWARTIDVKPATIYQRLNILGWSVERTLTTPPRRKHPIS